MEAATVSGQALSLLIMDVDHFKLINDTYGHLQGDDVLTEVAEILRKNLRGYDVPARYAGDEFVALLPDTPVEGAREVAERICAAIRGHTFGVRDHSRGTLTVNVSIGVATYPDHGADYDTLFAAADRALYQVKRQGRDGVAIARGADEAPAHLPLSIDRFVGRVEELRALVRLLEDATMGKPRVVAVTGEAGIGKTTLLRQLEPEVRLRAGSLVTGRCHEADVQPPYAPWAEVINHVLRFDITPRRGWHELPRLIPGLAGADGPAPMEQPSGGSKYMLLEEIAEFIREAAHDRPLVIVLDDMQWGDSASWDTLEYLLPQLEGERLLICLTMRAEETQGEVLERRRRLSRNEIFHELTLSRLSREELKQWIEAAFHRQDVGRELLSFLYRQTEGNPLFVVQVLRTLVDEGHVWYTGERWEWRPVSELRLPVAVSDLISRRLDRLSPKAKQILTGAAVIGREFELDLAIDAGFGSEEDLLDAVDEAIRASVLQSAAERGGDRYAFAHVKMAEVLRDAQNPRRLKKLHERVAQAIERRSPDAIADIVTHYDRAGNTEKTHAYALLAADRARNVYAHQEATEYLRIAERSATMPAQLAGVRVRLAQLAEAVGRYDEAEELCDLAIDWFQGQGEGEKVLSLRLMRERLRSNLGTPARRTLEAVLALDEEAKALGADRDRVAILTLLSRTHFRLGDNQAAERVAWECVHLAERLGETRLLAESLNRLGITLQQDHPAQATEIYRRALELYERVGDYFGQSQCWNNIGVVSQQHADWEQAQRALATAITLGRTAGAPDMWGAAALNLGVIYLKLGEFERAREVFGEALALFAAVKNSERQLIALYNLAHLDRERGEHESASELYDVASSLAQRIGQSDIEIGALAGAGLSLLALGKVDAARVALLDAEERIRVRRDWFLNRELFEALRIQLGIADGRVEESVQLFEDALAQCEGGESYAAPWLTAACAEVLLPHAAERVRGAVNRFAERTRTLGFAEISRRYEALLARA